MFYPVVPFGTIITLIIVNFTPQYYNNLYLIIDNNGDDNYYV